MTTALPGELAIAPSAAQYRVLVQLLRDGADNRTLARRLHLSEETVKCHIKALLALAGLSTRTELAVAILRRDIWVKIPR